MFTQCPACETYFRVTDDDLAAADGDVRCSRCDEVFDGRARLLTPAQEDALAVDAAPAAAELPASAATDDGPAIGDLFGTQTEPADPELDPPALDAAQESEASLATPDLPSAPLGFELPTGASPLLAQAGRPRPRLVPWLAGCGALVLVLAAQSIHATRESLARDPEFGPAVVAAYRALRLPLQPPTDLARLEVQRADVTSHPVYRDVLYITAVVTNEAAFAQPLPLLRVRLDDRWGEPVGVRIFRPEEYLRRAEPSARAEPGRSYAVALEVVDPGNEAVGYALTPCLPQGDSLICLGDG